MRLTIIGISDSSPSFSDEQLTLIDSTKYFCGGNRHKCLVEKYLPPKHEWVSIVVPLKNCFQKIEETNSDWIVFASGDPLFFGIGNTLKREFPKAQIKVFSTFYSLQMLAHHFNLPYGEYPTISLTGRDWTLFDKALIEGVKGVGILTDRKKTPHSIAQRMLDYNYSNYRIYYGECLGGPNQRVKELTMTQLLNLDFNHPNCMFFVKNDESIPRKGILETDFEPLDGRPNMITKMPVRLTTLALMNLESKSVFWDIGACTGSVSIEAKLNYPHLKIFAFEKREESQGIIHRNAKRFQVPDLNLTIGDYLLADKSYMEAPDAVFLGGYGGKMAQVLDDVKQRIKESGVIAFNSVSERSKNQFIEWCYANQYKIISRSEIRVDQHNEITILTAKK